MEHSKAGEVVEGKLATLDGDEVTGKSTGSTATIEHRGEAGFEDSSAGSSEVSVKLRGTLRSHLATPKHQQRIKGSVRLPQPRSDGHRPYLRQLFLTSAPLVVADVIAICIPIFFCSLIGLRWLNPADATSTVAVWLPPVIVAFVLINFSRGLYPGVCLGTVDEIRRFFLSLTIVALITAAGLRPRSAWYFDRMTFLIVAYCLCLVVVPLIRSRLRRVLAKASWWGFPTLICGNDKNAHGVYEWLMTNRRLALQPVGVVSDPDVLEIDTELPWYAGPWSKARAIAEQRHAYWAVLAESPDDTDDVTTIIEKYLPNLPHVYIVSERTGMPDHWNRHQMDEGLFGFVVENHLLLPIPRLVKRGMDLAIAVIAGLLLLPLLLALAVGIKLTSRGPLFYGHVRVGKGNSQFRAWKFRTMMMNADQEIHDYLEQHPELREEWERDHKLKDDPRVTRLGKWMRKWSLDELPQLWNVVRGEMSVVGPRPIVEDEISKYGEHFETFCSVLPGMTGLWQVCGRNDTTYDERVQLDVYYIHHWSPWLDIYLLGRTVATVLFTRGAY